MDRVESVVFANGDGQEQMATSGVAIRVGQQPGTDWLDGLVDLDDERRIVANDKLETTAYYVLVAGDIRSGSRQRVATAVGDGANVAARAAELLSQLRS
jgi:thioredoxin reductase (NADPH)